MVRRDRYAACRDDLTREDVPWEVIAGCEKTLQDAARRVGFELMPCRIRDQSYVSIHDSRGDWCGSWDAHGEYPPRDLFA